MRVFSWKRRSVDRDLSAFLDGELDDDRMADVGERLVFDPDYRDRRAEFERVAALSEAATTPVQIPSSAEFAAGLTQSLASDPMPEIRAARRRLNPALLASLGLLITAGVTFAGLRRRGLV